MVINNLMYDVWCNWVDGGSKGYQIPEYHEWKEDDMVVLYDQIPLVHITPELFSFIQDDCGDIPKEILSGVYQKAVTNEKNKRLKVDYAMIITDGKRVLAVNTESDTKPNLKSHLVPRHIGLVVEIVRDEVPAAYEWSPTEEVEEDDSLMGQILDLKPEYMVGLTRTEKAMKEIVMDCLFNISVSENRAEVKYWYIELFPDMIGNTELDTAELEDMATHMFDFLKVGWSENHEYFGSLLVRYYDIFKETWSDLVKDKKKVR